MTRIGRIGRRHPRPSDTCRLSRSWDDCRDRLIPPKVCASPVRGGVQEVAVRFEVSRVMDTIEQRLTTDIVMAQAVVDLGEITRYTDLDSDRPVNLIRIGMVVDAFGRYLRDGGALIYPVAPRQLLSEAGLTAKERMVLGRWTDDGLIEATRDAAARIIEIAELTGLPIITLRGHAEVAQRYSWLTDA